MVPRAVVGIRLRSFSLRSSARVRPLERRWVTSTKDGEAIAKLVSLGRRERADDPPVLYPSVGDIPVIKEALEVDRRKPSSWHNFDHERCLNYMQSNYDFARLKPPQAELLALAREIDGDKSGARAFQVISDDLIPTLKERGGRALPAWQTWASAVASTVKGSEHMTNAQSELLDLVRGQVSRMTENDLCDLLTSLLRVPIGVARQESISKIVEEAIKRSGILLSNPRTSNRLFTLCFLWERVSRHMFIGDYQSRRHWSKLRKRLLDHLLTNKRAVESFTPQQFVFLVFLAGEQRQFPLATKDKRSVQLLPKFVVDKVFSCYPSFTFTEVGMICHAFYKSHVAVDVEMGRMSRLLLLSLCNLDAKDVKKEEVSIGSVCKLLRHPGKDNEDLVSIVLDKYLPQMEVMSSQCLIRFATLFTRAWLSREEQIRILNSFVNAVNSSALLNSLRYKDLPEILVILYLMRYEDKGDQFLERLINSLGTLCFNDQRNGLNFVRSLNLLVKMNAFPSPYLDQLFDHVQSFEAEFVESESDRMKTLRLIIRMIFSLCNNSDRDLSQEIEFKRSYMKYLSVVQSIAEIDCMLEIKTGQRRMSKRLRRIFLNFHDPITTQNELGPVRESLKTTLTSLFGPYWQNVNVLPHLSNPLSFLIKLDKTSGKAVKLDRFYVQSLGATIVRPEKVTNCEWCVVILALRSQFNRDGDFSGPLNYVVDQTKSVGYQVVVINSRDYEALMSVGASQDVLKEFFQKQFAMQTSRKIGPI